MNIIETNIPSVLIIEPRVFKDSRGYFFESFSQREFDEKVTPILGHSIHFVQDNESMSSYGVMRGLHYQRMPYTQSKLVRCVKGAVPRRSRWHPQGFSDIWPACSSRIDRRQSSSVLHPSWLCSRLRRSLRDRRIPVQVRRVLSSWDWWRYQYQGWISCIDWRIPVEKAILSKKELSMHVWKMQCLILILKISCIDYLNMCILV